MSSLAVLEQVAGPLVWEEPQTRARGQLNGRPISFHVIRYKGGSAAVQVGAPVGRPIHIGIFDRRRTSTSRPEVRTGDPAFDDMYITVGLPPELIREALDPTTRGWLMSLYPDGNPDIDTWTGDDVRVYQSLSSDVSAERLTGLGGFAQHFAARLVESFDRAHHAVAVQHGPGAAATWIAQRHHDLAELERQRAAETRKVLAVVGLIIAAIVAAVIAGIIASAR